MPPKVKESVIRLMTRLAQQHGAVNLSQGFPNEAPPAKVRLALAHAVISGNGIATADEQAHLSQVTEQDLKQAHLSQVTEQDLKDYIASLLIESTSNGDVATDVLNQYSPPMGRADARHAVAHYYKRLYGYAVSEDNITLTLGATEAVATAIRSVTSPGDNVAIFEPFHEQYPSQCGIFYCNPVYITLRASMDGTWHYDPDELRNTIVTNKVKAIILNTPHNPTGKVFTYEELKEIVDLCIQNDVYIITDEIYEHMTYPDESGNHQKHMLIPKAFPEAADRTLVCNSISKSASATGWRLGWTLHPPHLSDYYRGIHDQMVAMAPHPMQYASMTYLSLPDEYFQDELQKRYQQRIFMLADALNDVGFRVGKPHGAYYLFADYRGVRQLKDLPPMDASMYLIEEVGVATVPGDNFYGKSSDGENYLRFAACRSMADIRAAVEKLKAGLSAA
ncbi:hypothetical protein ACHAXT_007739 [Thalassiosira profunda]